MKHFVLLNPDIRSSILSGNPVAVVRSTFKDAADWGYINIGTEKDWWVVDEQEFNRRNKTKESPLHEKLHEAVAGDSAIKTYR